MRFFLVSTVALVANLAVLHMLVTLGLGEVVAQAIAIVLVTPMNFVGNKLWSFGPSKTERARRGRGRLSRHAASRPRLKRSRTAARLGKTGDELALANPKVASWLERYPPDTTTSADFPDETSTWSSRPGRAIRARSPRQWSRTRRPGIRGVDGPTGRVEDGAGAKGRSAARPSKAYVWLAFCLVFFLGLANSRRPLSVRNLDLVILVGSTVSLAFFDRGEIFLSVPTVYPCWRTSSRAAPGSAYAGGRTRSRPSGRPGSSPRRSSFSSAFASGSTLSTRGG